MTFGIGTALGIGTSAFGAATSAIGASRQNAAIESSMQQQRRALIDQEQQLADRTGLELQKIRQNAQQVQGRLRVAAAESGTGFGGSYAALQQQAAFDEATNREVTLTNFENQVQAGRSGYRASLSQLEAQEQNPLLQGFMGAFDGLEAGLAIGNTIQQAQLARKERARYREKGIDSPYSPVNLAPLQTTQQTFDQSLAQQMQRQRYGDPLNIRPFSP